MRHQRSRGIRAVVVAGLAAASLALATPTPAAGAQVPVPSKPAIFHNGTWYLRDSMSSGPATSTFRYGAGGDIPVMGDWDGDGDDTVGVVRITTDPGGQFLYVWHLRNTNSAGPADITFSYGRPVFVAVDMLGTIPVAGDWDGDGDDGPGVVKYSPDINGNMQWHLRNNANGGAADHVINYSRGRDTPIVGDWDGDGDDTPGVVRFEDHWLLRNNLGSGQADVSFRYGSNAFELPVVGDWDGNGTDTPAVLRNNPPSDFEGGFETWLFRNVNGAGSAQGQITFGSDSQTVFLPVETIPRLSWT